MVEVPTRNPGLVKNSEDNVTFYVLDIMAKQLVNSFNSYRNDLLIQGQMYVVSIVN